LPEKVLKPLRGKPIIKEILERCNSNKNVDITILATSTDSTNDKLASLVKEECNLEIFRGSEEDVLDRYCAAASKYSLDQVIRVTGDNPIIDNAIVDGLIKSHIETEADYSYTSGYPLGMNIEIASTKALLSAKKCGQSKLDKEHVTYYIRNNPDVYSVNRVFADLPKEIAQLRLTIDTEQDYLMFQLLFDFLKPKTEVFGLREVIRIYQSKPYLFSINQDVVQKKQFETERKELNYALSLLQRQDLQRAAKVLESHIMIS